MRGERQGQEKKEIIHTAHGVHGSQVAEQKEPASNTREAAWE